MAPQDQDDRERLRDVAAAQYPTIRDPAVFACWHVIVEAAEQGWLTSSSLPTMIDILERGSGHGVEEYSLDVIDEQTIEVAFLDEHYRCPRAAMLFELKRLAAAVQGEPSPAEGDDAAGAQAVLLALSRLASSSPETREGALARAEAVAALAAFDSGGSNDKVDAIRDALDQLQPPERENLVASLRALTDWVERPDGPAGKSVDAVIARLETTLGPLLESGRRAERAETSRRISDDARDTIARRISEATGEDPPSR